MITKRASDAFYVVTNAAKGTEDLAWFAVLLTEWNTSERSKMVLYCTKYWGLLAPIIGPVAPCVTSTLDHLTPI
jgi:glycine cleavage system aminomethyltransferase T